MSFKELKETHPKKFSEECALVSVCFTMGKIKDDWYLNYISPPGGAWQELYVLKGEIEKRFYVGKNEKRADLIMQKDNQATIFYIAEAKEFFRDIMINREKIDNSLETIYKRLKNLKGGNLKPIYSYIIGINTTGLEGDFFTDAIQTEFDYVQKSINKLPPILGGRVCILAYWDRTKTKFSLIFSNDFPKDNKQIFKKIFL